MEFKFFTDLIAALGEITTGLKAVVQLPKTGRETIRRTLVETYRPIDTKLNMLIIRLGDILLPSSDKDFLDAVARLDNNNEWMQAERELRHCRSLHVALRETEALAGRLIGAVSTKDWNNLLQKMHIILATEDEVVLFIGQHNLLLADTARTAAQDTQQAKAVRED